MLNFCANNYLGLANHPALVAAGKAALDRYGYGMASVRFICGTQEVHKALEARLSRLPRHRGHHPLLVLLRRQRRALRDAARAGGRDHLRRAQPRLDHRRRPALQGQAPTATPTTTWPTSSAACKEARGRPPPADRDRRRLLDGRHHRRPAGDLRPRRPLRRDGDGRRQPRRSASSAPTGAAPPSSAAWPTASTSSPARSARRSAAPPAATPAAGARSSRCCASARAPTSSPTRWRRSIAAASLTALDLVEAGDDLRRRLDANAATFRAEMARARLHPGRAGTTRSSR